MSKQYFHYHTPDFNTNLQLQSMRCITIKKNGQQCKNIVVIGMPCCRSHLQTEYNVAVRPSQIPNAGKGLYAYNGEPYNNEIVFRTGQKICPYYGEIINLQTLEDRYGIYTAPYGIQVDNNTYEDGARMRGVGSLINHRANPNVRYSVGRDKKIYIVAIKNIRNNVELYANYGRDYVFNEPIQTTTNKQKYNI